MNSPATFQRAMNIALDGMLDKYVMIYIDDVIIYSRSWREHLTHIRNVLQRFREYQLCAKLGKCCFGMTIIKFLGHMISEEGIQPDPDKTAVINKIQDLQSPKKAKSFLAMVGYYQRFIKDFSKRTHNLWALSNDKGPWNNACKEEMEFLKTCLKQEPVCVMPDFEENFILTTDGSKWGFDAILSQIQDGTERVIAYASKTTSPVQENWSQPELEAAAVVWAFDKFRPYLLDKQFTLITDCSAMKSFRTISGKSAKMERWSLKMQTVKYDIQHRPGISIPHVDYLSRAKISFVYNVTVEDVIFPMDIDFLPKVRQVVEVLWNDKSEIDQSWYHGIVRHMHEETKQVYVDFYDGDKGYFPYDKEMRNACRRAQKDVPNTFDLFISILSCLKEDEHMTPLNLDSSAR